jgi:hypothetical protein
MSLVSRVSVLVSSLSRCLSHRVLLIWAVARGVRAPRSAELNATRVKLFFLTRRVAWRRVAWRRS